VQCGVIGVFVAVCFVGLLGRCYLPGCCKPFGLCYHKDQTFVLEL
jgi:hypothetical protein